MNQYAKIELKRYLELMEMEKFHEKESTDGVCLYFQDHTHVVYSKEAMILELTEQHNKIVDQLNETIDGHQERIKELIKETHDHETRYSLLLDDSAKLYNDLYVQLIPFNKLKWYQFKKINKALKQLKDGKSKHKKRRPIY